MHCVSRQLDANLVFTAAPASTVQPQQYNLLAELCELTFKNELCHPLSLTTSEVCISLLFLLWDVNLYSGLLSGCQGPLVLERFTNMELTLYDTLSC